jgi:hypothetical protein
MSARTPEPLVPRPEHDAANGAGRQNVGSADLRSVAINELATTFINRVLDAQYSFVVEKFTGSADPSQQMRLMREKLGMEQSYEDPRLFGHGPGTFGIPVPPVITELGRGVDDTALRILFDPVTYETAGAGIAVKAVRALEATRLKAVLDDPKVKELLENPKVQELLAGAKIQEWLQGSKIKQLMEKDIAERIKQSFTPAPMHVRVNQIDGHAGPGFRADGTIESVRGATVIQRTAKGTVEYDIDDLRERVADPSLLDKQLRPGQRVSITLDEKGAAHVSPLTIVRQTPAQERGGHGR